jgi:hypothetical protein
MINLEEELEKFGIRDAKTINRLTNSFGKAIDIEVEDNLLRIFYNSQKYPQVYVEKSQCLRIDPVTNQVIETIDTHKIVESPKTNYTSMTAKKKSNSEWYEKDQGMWG